MGRPAVHGWTGTASAHRGGGRSTAAARPQPPARAIAAPTLAGQWRHIGAAVPRPPSAPPVRPGRRGLPERTPAGMRTPVWYGACLPRRRTRCSAIGGAGMGGMLPWT